MRRRRSASRSRWASAARGVDERFLVAGPLRKALNRVVPQSRSFLLRELTVYSFVVLLLTGTFLTFFFDASEKEIRYDGPYVPLHGVRMSEAFASTMRISFEVRGGLFIRQVHHWAALLFLATLVLHMFRVLFTGAFRKPREATYVLGVVLVGVALLTGFTGYNLPDDVFGGSSLFIAWSILLSIPVVGTWLAFSLFGGEFPGTVIVERIYIAHVFLLPGLLVTLIAAHLALVVRQGHARYPMAGRRERAVGRRAFLAPAVRSAGLFALVAGVLAALGGLAQVQPVWLYGPREAGVVSSFSQPDWYMFFLEGSLRLSPPWDLHLGRYTVPQLFWAALALPAVLFFGALVFPWVEALVSRDHARHDVLQRPRDAPLRTGVVAAALSLWGVLTLAAMDDAIAYFFSTSVELVVRTLRVAFFVAPIATLVLTRRICLELQQRERDLRDHGRATGVATYVDGHGWVEVTEAPAPEEPVAAPEPPEVPADEEVGSTHGRLGLLLRRARERWRRRGGNGGGRPGAPGGRSPDQEPELENASLARSSMAAKGPAT